MHLKQVETFLTVAECGSFSRAGEKLFISSSAVAQQIGSLEEDIGASLFHRTTHGVRLTEIGRYLAAEGRELVERSHIIQEHIQTMRFEQENCIVLGTSMWQNCSLFYSRWGKFVSEHEQYQLRTVRIRDEFRLHRQGEYPDLIESVRDGEPWQADYSFLFLNYLLIFGCACSLLLWHAFSGCRERGLLFPEVPLMAVACRAEHRL